MQEYESRKMFKKIKEWYKKQTDTTKAFIILGIILVIGIIIRWSHIVEAVGRGFNFFRK